MPDQNIDNILAAMGAGTPAKPGAVRPPMSPDVVAGRAKVSAAMVARQRGWVSFVDQVTGFSFQTSAGERLTGRGLKGQLWDIIGRLQSGESEKTALAAASPKMQEFWKKLSAVPGSVAAERAARIIPPGGLKAAKLAPTTITELIRDLAIVDPDEGAGTAVETIRSKSRSFKERAVVSSEGANLVESAADPKAGSILDDLVEAEDGAAGDSLPPESDEPAGARRKPKTSETPKPKIQPRLRAVHGSRGLSKAYKLLDIPWREMKALKLSPSLGVFDAVDAFEDLLKTAEKSGIKEASGETLGALRIEVTSLVKKVETAKGTPEFEEAVKDIGDRLAKRTEAVHEAQAAAETASTEAKAAGIKATAERTAKRTAKKATTPPLGIRDLLKRVTQKGTLPLAAKGRPKLAALGKTLGKAGTAGKIFGGAGVLDALLLLSYYLGEVPKMDRKETKAREHYEAVDKLEAIRPPRTTEDYLMELQAAERAGRNPALAGMLMGGPPGGGTPDVLGGIGQQLARGEVLV